MRTRFLMLAMLLATPLMSCGDDATVYEAQKDSLSAGGAGPVGGGGGGRRMMREASAPPAASAPSKREAPNAPSANAVQSMWAGQKLIRNAALTVEVDNVARAVRLAEGIARRTNAFVADVQANQAGNSRGSAQISVRIASANFNTVLASLRTLGKVQNETIETQDITKEYADVATRIAVKEDAVIRLRTLLGNRTGKLSDVLDVERELARAIAELEQMKGERRYYDERVAVSIVTISLVEPNVILKPTFLSNVAASFNKSVEVFGRSIAAAVYLLTFLIPWALIASVGWWVSKRFGPRPRGLIGTPQT